MQLENKTKKFIFLLTTYTEVVRHTTYTEVVRQTTYTEVVRQTTYTEVVQDFITRFWSNLTYLRRITWKSSHYNKILNFWFSTGRLPSKSSSESQISDTVRSIAKLTCLPQMTSTEVVSWFLENFFKQKYANIYKGRLPKKSDVETTSLEVVLCKILIAKMT